MSDLRATAIAHPNIAFIKYWGNRDDDLRIPANGSLSMNLAGLETRTTVEFDADLKRDELTVNAAPANEAARLRASALLDRVRRQVGMAAWARITSANNFPTGSGIASSASAFAALALAASRAASLELGELQLSILARTGSGSACRSIPAGFVEWRPGDSHETSFAESIALPAHWDLVDLVAVVSRTHKHTGSASGHRLAGTSPLQAARLEDAPRRLAACRAALLARDFEAFAAVVELDSHLMHAVMMTSSPALLYWQPATLAVMQAIAALRSGGLPACTTIDAGPNVHVLTLANHRQAVQSALESIPGVQDILICPPGGPARLA
ncbi:MAG: diphosphomevalonate decarboxylase [Chloroflexi bacterium]|nr:diphosphomevalonate decarboxylase [Chloroflexota bacterium]